MSRKDTMWIAFPNGGIIPAAVLGEDKDRSADAHQPIEVPAAYAEHLVHDRFAYRTEPPKAKGKAKAREQSPQELKAEAVAAAEAKVTEVEERLAKADMVDKAAIETELADARKALEVARA